MTAVLIRQVCWWFSTTTSSVGAGAVLLDCKEGFHCRTNAVMFARFPVMICLVWIFMSKLNTANLVCIGIVVKDLLLHISNTWESNRIEHFSHPLFPINSASVDTWVSTLSSVGVVIQFHFDLWVLLQF